VDIWDDTGDSIVEHVAGVDDFEVGRGDLPGSRSALASGAHYPATGQDLSVVEPKRNRELRPCVGARGQGIGLGEILEQFCLLLRRHADAAVRDGELDPVASVRHFAHLQRDLALLRELTGIA
jgi:hypothetical protein